MERVGRSRLFWNVTLGVALPALVVLLASAAFFHQYVAAAVLKKSEDYATFLLTGIRGSLFQGIMHNRREATARTVAEIARLEDVRLVTLHDRQGRLILSSIPGRGLSAGAPQARATGASGPSIVRTSANGEHLLVVTMPVPNAPECRECHTAGEEVLGHVGLELSLANFDRLVATGRVILTAAVSLVVVLIVGVNIWFFARRVIFPLNALRHKVEEVEGGDLQVSVDAAGKDEIAALQRSFGQMVARVQEMHRIEIEREREMALMVQDFKHQMEISAVNRQLQKRLAEIDQANRKIRRLAGRLEEKNVNLGKMVKKITALNRLGVALSAELEMERLIKLVVNVAVKGMRSECGFLMLLDEESRTLRMAFGMGLGEEYDQTLPVEVGESVSGVVAERGEPVLVEDVGKQGSFRRVSRFGFLRKSVVCAPLKVKNRVLGTIELTNKRGGEAFNTDDLEMLSSICAQAAIAIDNAKLYQKIQQSYFDTVRALIQAVEEKDRYTRGHSERVTLFALKIANMLGLDQRRLDILKYAGYLHDIGKIGIDVNILQKNGRLSSEEFELVKNHPLIGERIIAPIEFLKDVRACISQHHERFDGFGYPCGLSGAEMGIESRILSVADAYDAMITDRPYRRALPKGDAVAELRRCSGSQFDPEVVGVFVEILETDQEILELERSISSVGT